MTLRLAIWIDVIFHAVLGQSRDQFIKDAPFVAHQAD